MIGLGQRLCCYSLTMFSAYNILMDFIFAIYPWLIMWKLDMKKSEKLGLCVVMSLVCLLCSTMPRWRVHRISLTVATGNGHRNLNRNPNPLEIPRQRQRRTVLLAPRHVGDLVLFRSCRHHHCAMRTSPANTDRRSQHNASVETAAIHG